MALGGGPPANRRHCPPCTPARCTQLSFSIDRILAPDFGRVAAPAASVRYAAGVKGQALTTACRILPQKVEEGREVTKVKDVERLCAPDGDKWSRPSGTAETLLLSVCGNRCGSDGGNCADGGADAGSSDSSPRTEHTIIFSKKSPANRCMATDSKKQPEVKTSFAPSGIDSSKLLSASDRLESNFSERTNRNKQNSSSSTKSELRDSSASNRDEDVGISEKSPSKSVADLDCGTKRDQRNASLWDSDSDIVSNGRECSTGDCGLEERMEATHEPVTWPAWVYCTRYSDRPSSGPRSRRQNRRQRLGDEKRSRTAFTCVQLSRLRQEFQESRYLTEQRRVVLARELRLSEAQVKIWFQNKRAKLKKASGQKNPLAMELMAQGLYNHGSNK